MTREEKNKRNREYRQRNRERVRELRASNLEGRWKELRNRARRDGRGFRISLATYKRMINCGCHYCGKTLMDETGGSLDRINNNNPNYVTRNVVPCCTNCNYIKSKVLTSHETSFIMEMLKQYRDGEEWAVQKADVLLNENKDKRKKYTRG